MLDPNDPGYVNDALDAIRAKIMEGVEARVETADGLTILTRGEVTSNEIMCNEFQEPVSLILTAVKRVVTYPYDTEEDIEVASVNGTSMKEAVTALLEAVNGS